jgi:predicted nuclease of predicted toxin-antitoxin system
MNLDENMPGSLVARLSAVGHDVDTVPAERIAGRDDETVWNAAQASGRFLITQDLDFSDIRRFQPGTHEGLLLVRLHAPGRLELADRVEAVFRSENVEQWRGCFVVVTERKLRVRR